MQVNEEIFQWFSGLGLLGLSEGKKISEDRYNLGKNSIVQFENGQMFAKILKTLSKHYAQSLKRAEPPFPELDSLKEVNTPAARVYNWNIVQECYKRINIQLSPENKGQIVSGNHETTFAFLRDIISATLSYVPDNVAKTQKKIKQRQKPPEYKEEIDVTKVDVTKDILKSRNCLEFFVILLSRHLSLPAGQTASLFTNTSKYLAHLLAKGVKGLFDPITNFYQDVYTNIPQLLSFFKEDSSKKSMNFAMNALKPGLVSKSFEVAQWCARLFSRLSFEFGDGNLLAASWDWFVCDNGGLATTLLGLRRHPDLREQVVSILLQFSRFNFIELFTIHMKKAQPDPKDLLSTYVILLKPLTEQSSVSEEFLGAGILDEWIDYAIENASDDYRNPQDVRINALTLLTEVWKLFPYKVEENEYKSNQIMNLLTKGIKDKQMPLVMSTLGLLFELLIFFGVSKSQFAPSVYRILTLCAIENHSNLTIREFILNNFSNSFESLDTIPLNILVEPLVRQIQVTDGVSYFFNVFDFDFFSSISKNDKLQLKNAIQILDLFFKIYLNNVIFANLSSVPILNIIHKFIESETLHEFVIKFIKVALAMYYASEKKKKPKEKSMPLYNNRSSVANSLAASEIESEIVASQKRALIVEMVKSIVAINSSDLNNKIKPLVAHTNIQIKQFSKQNSKGMVAILQLFGSPEEILEKYEKEYNEHQQNAKSDKEKLEMEIVNYDGMEAHQADILKAMEENLKKYKQFTRAEALHFALLRNPNADPKILKNLTDLKNNYKYKEETKKRESEQLQEENERVKQGLRKALVKRSLEQGVSSLNKKDLNGALLFQYASRDKPKKEGGIIINQHPEIRYFDLEMEEERDKELINILLRKYQKLLKNIYVKYSNSGNQFFNPLFCFGNNCNLKLGYSLQFTAKNLNTFESIKEHSSVISDSDLFKFVKDYDLSSQISQDEHQAIVRFVIIKEAEKKIKKERSISPVPASAAPHTARSVKQSPLLLRSQLHRQQTMSMMSSTGQDISMMTSRSTQPKQTNMFEKGQSQRNYAKTDLKDSKSLDYKDFLDFFVQFACNLYTRFPYEMGHLPLSLTVQKLFDHLREVTIKKGQSTLLFDEADSAYFGEAEIIKEYNRQLEINPEYVLPKGYKKIKVKELRFNYELDDKFTLPMSESLKVSYDILNDLFKEKLSFFLLEPKSVTKDIYKAIPVIGNPIQAESQFMDVFKTPQTVESRKLERLKQAGSLSYSASASVLAPWGKPDSTKTIPSIFNYKQKYSDRKVLDIDPVHKLDLGLKLALSAIPLKDKFSAEQVAFCLDDIIKTVESGQQEVVRFKKTENVIVQEKKIDSEEQKLQKIKFEENYKKGHNLVQTLGKKIEEETAEQKREKKEKEDREKAEKEEQKKRKIEEIDNFWKEKKEIFDESKQRKDEEKKRLIDEKQQEEKEKKQQKEREAQIFFKKQVEKHSEKFQEKKERDKQREEEKKKREEDQKNLISKLHLNSIKVNQELVGQDKDNNKKIKELLQSEDIVAVFKKNDFKLAQLFYYLKNLTFREVSSAQMSENDISFKTFNWFCNRFNLFPGVIPTTQDIAMIYHSVTRNKESVDLKPIGANEKEFREAILRMAIKGKKIFNKFAARLEKGEELNESQMKDIADEENEQEEEESKKKTKKVIDFYGNVDDVNSKTFEALIYYLGLPNERNAIGEALKSVIQSGSKPNKFLKKDIKEKIKKDPKELIRYQSPAAQFSNISNIKLASKLKTEGNQQEED